MTRPRLARTVLAADGLGCAVATVAMAASDPIAGAVNPSKNARWPVTGALAATSAVLLAGSRRREPTDRDLKRAAAINIGWASVCLLALAGRPSPAGRALLAGTAALDGGAAIAQWALRSGDRLHGERD